MDGDLNDVTAVVHVPFIANSHQLLAITSAYIEGALCNFIG